MGKKGKHDDELGEFAHCFKKASSDVYRGNTSSGYRGPGWQGHHVLVADCFKLASTEADDSDQAAYIRVCFSFTDWDINKDHNMLGLPVLKSYVLAYKDMDGGGKQAGKQEFKHLEKYLTKPPVLKAGVEVSAPHNLPCHQPVNWGHIDYTKEVDTELKKRIWKTLKRSDEKHVSAKVIAGELGPLASEFSGKLTERGCREGGTSLNWRERHNPERENSWFHPFCMSARPNKFGIA
jgi:hypothetical protein